MLRQKIAILYGGPSSEHEVSISSAQNVMGHIDQELFEVVEVFISKEGMFLVNGQTLETAKALDELKTIGVEIIFPILHGSFGEDGQLQKLLEERKMRFVGSGSVASALAINKEKANEIYANIGLHIPHSQIINRDGRGDNEIQLHFPIIIKPIDEGSSVGLFKIESREEYMAQRDSIFKNHIAMLAQEFISGREFTCGVIDIEGKDTALPVAEIILNSADIFDYDTKYTAGACREVIPAEITEDMREQIQNAALKCHKGLGCKSVSRTDVILSKEGKLYILETNTLPGMTKTSNIPAEAAAAGIDLKTLTTYLLKSAGY